MFGMLPKREAKKKQKAFKGKQATTATVPSDTPQVEEEHVEFLHLRRWDYATQRLLPTGGITLAFVMVGGYYKVGAAFCSLKDMYQREGTANGKPVGRDLALARLHTDYSWVPWWRFHDEAYEKLPDFLDCEAGKAWLLHAYRNGLNLGWYLDTKYHRGRKLGTTPVQCAASPSLGPPRNAAGSASGVRSAPTTIPVPKPPCPNARRSSAATVQVLLKPTWPGSMT